MTVALFLLAIVFYGYIIGGASIAWRCLFRAQPEPVDVARLRLLPGDVVLLRVEKPITKEQIQRIREQFADLAPHNKLAVLDAGIKVDVLTFGDLGTAVREALADDIDAALGARVAPDGSGSA